MLFREDPYVNEAALESSHRLRRATVTSNEILTHPLDPSDYCECGNCQVMQTREESVCCCDKSLFYQITPLGNSISKQVQIWMLDNIFVGTCQTNCASGLLITPYFYTEFKKALVL